MKGMLIALAGFLSSAQSHAQADPVPAFSCITVDNSVRPILTLQLALRGADEFGQDGNKVEYTLLEIRDFTGRDREFFKGPGHVQKSDSLKGHLEGAVVGRFAGDYEPQRQSFLIELEIEGIDGVHQLRCREAVEIPTPHI